MSTNKKQQCYYNQTAKKKLNVDIFDGLKGFNRLDLFSPPVKSYWQSKIQYGIYRHSVISTIAKNIQSLCHGFKCLHDFQYHLPVTVQVIIFLQWMGNSSFLSALITNQRAVLVMNSKLCSTHKICKQSLQLLVISDTRLPVQVHFISESSLGYYETKLHN